ncbi:MAG TPA: hypothetical protein DDZ39_11950 [Flavobacteriaceae bacterium]|nr:hypothetical protein [Flavobacteriaceae bacterium]
MVIPLVLMSSVPRFLILNIMKITNHYIKSIKLFIISFLFVSCSSNTIDGVYKVIIDDEETSIIGEMTYTIKQIEGNLYKVTLEMIELDRETKTVKDSRVLDSEALYLKENRTLTLKKRRFFLVFSEDLKSFNHDGVMVYKNKTVKTSEKEIKENKKKNKK